MNISDSFGEAFRSTSTGNLLLMAAALVASFAVCFLLIPLIIKLSNRYNLLDKPNERKVHKSPISRLGGLGIVSGILVTSFIWFFPGDGKILIHLLSGIAILLVIGVRDDIKELSPKIKFLGQIVAALLMARAGLRIESLFGFLGIDAIPVVVQYLLTVFIVVGLINAFNLIDGIDGLAGGLTLMDMLFFFFLFFTSRDLTFSFIAASIAGALLAFLRYNWHPARIFMGDTGSMVLGYLLSAAGIRLIIESHDQQAAFSYSETTILVFATVLLPVYDTLRVSLTRILKRKSPFSADKTHVHHLLMATGFNHPKTARILYAANLTLIATGFLLRSQSLSLVAPLLFLEGLLFMDFLTFFKLVKAWLKDRILRNKALRIKGDNRLLLDNLKDKNGKA